MNRHLLERLVTLVDHDLAQVDAERPDRSAAYSREDWSRHDARVSAIITKLVQSEDARYFPNSGEPRLKLAGVSTTCTSGQYGLLRNWLSAARRKIANTPTDDGFNAFGSGPVPIEEREA